MSGNERESKLFRTHRIGTETWKKICKLVMEKIKPNMYIWSNILKS